MRIDLKEKAKENESMTQERFIELVLSALDRDTIEDALNEIELLLYYEANRDREDYPELAKAEEERAYRLHDALREIGYYK